MRGAQAYAVVADLGKVEDCKRTVDEAVEKMGGLDILVNRCGEGGSGTTRPCEDRWCLSLRAGWHIIRILVRLARWGMRGSQPTYPFLHGWSATAALLAACKHVFPPGMSGYMSCFTWMLHF